VGEFLLMNPILGILALNAECVAHQLVYVLKENITFLFKKT
jgi:hypothetical protein